MGYVALHSFYFLWFFLMPPEFLPFAFTHVESQPVTPIAPDRGEVAAILDVVTARFDGQGNDDRFISGMGAGHQFADRCQAP